MAKHVAEGTPTQVAHPMRAVVRTAVAYLLAAALFLAAAIPVLQEELAPILAPEVQGYLATALLIVTCIAAGITRLMAIARAQDLLAKIGLGTGVETEGRRAVEGANHVPE